MSDLREFHGPNAGYVLDLYQRFLRDPDSVDGSWRDYFRTVSPAEVGDAAGPPSAPRALDVDRLVNAHKLAEAIRARGHTAAHLDPLGGEVSADPALEPETHRLTEADLESLPSSVVRGSGYIAGRTGTAAEAMVLLRKIYSGSIGYEFDHVLNATERAWIRDTIESGQLFEPIGAEGRRALLRRLSEVEGFEKYLHKTFFGQKRFSVEGTDTLIPILDEIIRRSAAGGTQEILIGMAHRGRLNVLTHLLGKPYALILSGFQGATQAGTVLAPDDFTGDVKYHMGWHGAHRGTDSEVRVTLTPNPSHLEFVNPIVVGMARAAQDDTSVPGSTPPRDAQIALPILVHGDAAFPGQGVVAETLNISGLEGYAVGGTIHIIANNQIGFTTEPSAARSTRYASDLAKGFEIPIVHVNADDVVACIAAARLAQAYRERFHKDFLIDLIGYRRWGHNEGDEPLFTQPNMYGVIRAHPTVREQWAERLIREEVVTEGEAEGMLQEVFERLEAARAELEGGVSFEAEARTDIPPTHEIELPLIQTAVLASTLREHNEALLSWPAGFAPNSRLAKQLERRREAFGPDGGIDWGHAESLAFATLLAEGVPIRITGQDVLRGTFSHRHQVLYDANTGAPFVPLASLPSARASFEIHNSPLSEMAVVGFEYGYSVSDPEVLVLWEAQFGDFVNGAQVFVDQFVAAAEVKWQQRSGLVLLLPHGYEGQGPEHSSARLERFLQLAAQDNIRVANCTTAAQYFHLLRRQALLLGRDSRPLVVMSPKSLLRHPLAAARLEELTGGRFSPVIGDRDAAERAEEVTRLLLCSGKVYVDLVASDDREKARNVALARVEELYPFAEDELRAQLERFPALQEIVWVQEEPRNMGAWEFMSARLRELVDDSLPVRYEGRPCRASPAEGYADKHAAEQARIVRSAWVGAEAPQRRRVKRA